MLGKTEKECRKEIYAFLEKEFAVTLNPTQHDAFKKLLRQYVDTQNRDLVQIRDGLEKSVLKLKRKLAGNDGDYRTYKPKKIYANKLTPGGIVPNDIKPGGVIPTEPKRANSSTDRLPTAKEAISSIQRASAGAEKVKRDLQKELPTKSYLDV